MKNKNYSLYLIFFVSLLLLSCSFSGQKKESRTYVLKIKEMFSQMVEDKNASLIPKYYARGFELYSNGQKYNYCQFLDSHVQLYSTGIKYSVQYDEAAFVQEGQKVAGRVWVTIKEPGEKAKKYEVMMIAQFQEGKIYRLWELSYPDWRAHLKVPNINPPKEQALKTKPSISAHPETKNAPPTPPKQKK